MTKVLVFDSGSGSLPIAAAIREYLPSCELSLLADIEFFPYGEKPDSMLITRMQQILSEAVALIEPQIMVLACNTASTIGLDILRKQFPIPIIGVVPAIKPAAEATKSGVIGLIATPATIKRSYTADLVADFASDCEVIMHGSTDLVVMSEKFVKTGQFQQSELHEILSPFIYARDNKGLDQLVLGCTHFALLRDAIDEILENVAVVDSSNAIGRQVHRIVNERSLESDLSVISRDLHYYHTANGQVLQS